MNPAVTWHEEKREHEAIAQILKLRVQILPPLGMKRKGRGSSSTVVDNLAINPEIEGTNPASNWHEEKSEQEAVAEW